MFSFFKKSRSNYPVPEWANFFSQPEYNRFVDIIDTYFRKKKVAYFFDHEPELEVAGNEFGAERLGLINLAQQLRQLRPSDWKEMISSHFETLARAAMLTEEFNKKAHDFSYARDYLGVRLYHHDYIAHIEDGLTIGKPIAENVFGLLVFDFSDSIVNVRLEQTIQWNKTNEELFQIGIENIRKKYPLTVSRENLGDHLVDVIVEEHFFVPNIIFDLDLHPALTSDKGVIIAMPHRHAVFMYPIKNLGALTLINTLIPVVNGMFKEGPGALSDKLYWYYEGRFVTLPYKVDADSLQFFPPGEFLEVLNTLAGD